MPDINEICLVIAVAAQLGLLIYVVISGIDTSSLENMPIWQAQIIGAATGAFISASALFGSIFLKQWLFNKQPLEFKFELKKRDEDENVRFIFHYKNNTKYKIKIESYHMTFTKLGIDKIVYSTGPRPHFSAEIIYPKKGWQEGSPFVWVDPKEYYKIKEQGIYNILVTIAYRYKDKYNQIFDVITEPIDVAEISTDNRTIISKGPNNSFHK